MEALRPLLRSLHAAVIAAALQAAVTAPAAAQSAAPTDADPVAPVAPDPDPGAAELNDHGLALYAARDYRHALESFLGAQALENDPNVLFNIGRCYEQLGELEAALEKYQEFIAAPDSDPAGVQRARASIEGIAAARRAQARAAHSQELPLARLLPAQPTRMDPAVAHGNAAPWILAGSSVALVGLGATLYALGAHDHAQITDMPAYGKADVPAAMTWRQADNLVHSGNSKKLAGGILLGAGGALGTTTLLLLLSRGQEREAERPLSVAPVVLDRGGGLLLAGRFR